MNDENRGTPNPPPPPTPNGYVTRPPAPDPQLLEAAHRTAIQDASRTMSPMPGVHTGTGDPEMIAVLHAVRAQLREVVVGQERMIERLLCCVLGGGHALLEGVPGVAKTTTLAALARSIGGSFSRIQFTADLLPSDIVGTRVFRAATGEFDVVPGPVFANFVLADEINRAPGKSQSAMLEAMAELQVTLAGNTTPLPSPFMVMATQNPIESEGVFPLPEAQRDRFMMRITVPLPSEREERQIVARVRHGQPKAQQVAEIDEIVRLRRLVEDVAMPEPVLDYAVRLVMATRDPRAAGIDGLDGLIENGASPRASISIDRAARAMALLRGRTTATCQDVYDVAYDCLNHRLVLSFDAMAQGVNAHDVCAKILTTVPAPLGS